MRRESGFTLVELLIVVAIIGILSTTAITSYRDARQAAVEVAVREDLRAMAEDQTLYLTYTPVVDTTTPTTPNPPSKPPKSKGKGKGKPNPTPTPSPTSTTTLTAERYARLDELNEFTDGRFGRTLSSGAAYVIEKGAVTFSMIRASPTNAQLEAGFRIQAQGNNGMTFIYQVDHTGTVSKIR